MFHIKKPLTVTGCPSSSFFYPSHNIWMERTVKLSGSLGLAVIVGTKAVEHSYLDGFSRRCQKTKGPHFVAKMPNFKRR